jgi:hypothetical protein
MGARPLAEAEAVVDARLTRAVREVVRTLDADDLYAVAAQPSDVEALVMALGRSRARPADVDPRVLEALQRGRAAKAQMLSAEGGCVSAGQMGELLGISRQAVDKRRNAGQLLGVRDREGADWLYPLWQLQNGAILPGLERTLRVLFDGQHDAWAAMIFFLETDVPGGIRTPLEALRSGDEATVLRAAMMYGEHGAK